MANTWPFRLPGLEMERIPPVVRSDWRQGILQQRARGKKERRIWRFKYGQASRGEVREMKRFFDDNGMGAGEVSITPPGGGSPIIVTFSAIQHNQAGAGKYAVNVEFRELISTDT